MKHKMIDLPKDENSFVELNLSVLDTKMLYNACVDILDAVPEMIGYKRVAKDLKKKLDSHEKGGCGCLKKDAELDLWLITNISIWLNEPAELQNDGSILWSLIDGTEIILNPETKECLFVNSVMDTREYFAISGIVQTRGYVVEDAYTD